jgi:hypothetical protein
LAAAATATDAHGGQEMLARVYRELKQLRRLLDDSV